MGLLDLADSPMMGLATGLLAASGPSRMPVSVGQGLAMGLNGMREAQQLQQHNQLRQVQLEDMKRRQMLAEQQAQFKQQFLSNPAIPDHIRQGVAAGVIDLGDLMKPQKLGAEEALVSPFQRITGQGDGVIAQGPAKAPKIGTEAIYTPQGMWQTFETEDGRPNLNKPIGAPFRKGKDAADVSVSPKIDIKMGESVANQIGPMLKDSRIQADGAVKMFDAADRIERAINSGNVSSGPLTTPAMKVKQFFTGGSDNIRQTRQVIKSLAQMSVEARKQLQGQGQVTESEAAAVAKADAGDIDDLTLGELRDLATLTKRSAHFTAKSHADMLNNLGSEAATKNMVPFYNVRGLEPLLKHSPELPKIGGNPVEDLLKKYGG